MATRKKRSADVAAREWLKAPRARVDAGGRTSAATSRTRILRNAFCHDVLGVRVVKRSTGTWATVSNAPGSARASTSNTYSLKIARSSRQLDLTLM